LRSSPPKLTEKPIKSSCPQKVCAECGKPYEKDVERKSGSSKNIIGNISQRGVTRTTEGLNLKSSSEKRYNAEFKGWKPTCNCNTKQTKPGIVLDPMAGAGSTLVMAQKLGRRWLGIEISEKYAEMARERVGKGRNAKLEEFVR